MEKDTLKILINNGVGVLAMAFIFWFVLRPFVDSYLSTMEINTQILKEVMQNSVEDRELCLKTYDKILRQLEDNTKTLNRLENVRNSK